MPAMKRLIASGMTAALLITLLLASGCANRHVITLSNGTRITAVGKPQLREGNYHFKDAAGRDTYVPASRVREIAPASMATQPETSFNAPAAK
jgi:hypothetical protein